jgi:multidrug efflux pump subunit AcrA (membrane-fusion protein)
VKLTFGDGSTYGHEGLVDFTSATVDVNTGTIQARAVIDNPDHQLIPGQFVRATVSGVTADDAIVIPEVALMQSPQGQFVYTVGKDGKAKINHCDAWPEGRQQLDCDVRSCGRRAAHHRRHHQGSSRVTGPGNSSDADADAATPDTKKIAAN